MMMNKDGLVTYSLEEVAVELGIDLAELRREAEGEDHEED